MSDQSKTAPPYREDSPTPRANAIYLGLVRQNADPQRMGRISVWISDFGPDKPDFHVTVSYASPFAGVTPMKDVKEGDDTMDGSQKSYGWWATTPDIDNQVLVCFLNGDMGSGVYFASLYPQNMNHMVPGLAFGNSTDDAMNQQFAPYGPPVVEYNKKQTGAGKLTSTNATGEDNAAVKRPVFTPLAQGLIDQGLKADPERGPANTSARRESPSGVFGYSSPRGNTIHIDDGYKGDPTAAPTNEFIRFRTRSGAQILIHETSGYIYLITKGGKSWMEISDTGIDMFSEGMISMASGSDVNIQAGGAINMHGTTGVNIRAASINAYSSGNTNFVTSGDFLIESIGDTFFRASGTFGVEAVKNIGLDAGKDILMASCGVNSRNAKSILDNAGGASPDAVKLADRTAANGEVTTRVPTHEPFPHDSSASAGGATGVDSKGNPVQSVVDGSGNVSEVPANVPASLKKRANLLYCKLKAKGFKDIQIAAVLGCWQQESTLNPGAQEGGSAGQGIGLGQWSRDRLRGGGWGPGRKAKFLSYANQQGKDWKDIDVQIDFFVMELKSTESKAGNALFGATTLDQALTGMKYYERFGVAGRRSAYAAAYAKDIKAGAYTC